MIGGVVGAGEEMVDLVDEDDRVIGRAPRSEVRRRNLLHRGAGVLCRNSAGDVYVHRRTDSKDVFPGLYDAFAGGMVASGESYEDAARRELAEELGIVGTELRPLVKQRYRGPDLQTWNVVFETVWDGPISHQAEEVAWGAFVPVAELRRRLQTWRFVPDGLQALRYFLDREDGPGPDGARPGVTPG
ncbi:MAG TPA: NUDIX domain-containing protein [Actinomycetota bacterium]|nr:NUDIX domain-containing protein [Actinomycetota bacterium]